MPVAAVEFRKTDVGAQVESGMNSASILWRCLVCLAAMFVHGFAMAGPPLSKTARDVLTKLPSSGHCAEFKRVIAPDITSEEQRPEIEALLRKVVRQGPDGAICKALRDDRRELEDPDDYFNRIPDQNWKIALEHHWRWARRCSLYYCDNPAPAVPSEPPDQAALPTAPVAPEVKSTASVRPEVKSTAPVKPKVKTMASVEPEVKSTAPVAPEVRYGAYFGALAINPTTGAGGVGYSLTSQPEADVDAIRTCGVGCRSVAKFSDGSCISVSVSGRNEYVWDIFPSDRPALRFGADEKCAKRHASCDELYSGCTAPRDAQSSGVSPSARLAAFSLVPFAELERDLEIGAFGAMDHALQVTLETTPSGKIVEWSIPGRIVGGSVTAQSAYQDFAGRHCRRYVQTLRVDRKSAKRSGAACRNNYGRWK